MEQQVIGLDVSKAWLDGYLSASGRRLRVGNDAAGVRALVRSLGERAACLVVMEASGGYERTAHQELVAQGVLAAIVNPKRVRDFARGMGLEAKTDRVDAKVIARYGEVRRSAPTPITDPARAELGEILACRRRLIDEITVRRQQLEHLHSPAMRARVAKALAFLRQEERELTKLLRQKIEADRPLAADFALLTSMPGCGPILAATLLAEMPELGRARPPPGRRTRRPRPGGPGQRPAREPPRHQGRPRPGPPRPRHGRRRLPAHHGQPAQAALRPARRQRQSPQARTHRPHAQNPRHPQRHAQVEAGLEAPL